MIYVLMVGECDILEHHQSAADRIIGIPHDNPLQGLTRALNPWDIPPGGTADEQ